MSKIVITPRDVEKLVPNLETVGINDSVVAYRFKSGPYKGVAYTYVNIRFNVVNLESQKIVDADPAEFDPEDDKHALEVGFEYIPFENPHNKTIDEKNFRDHIGKILVHIIENSQTDGEVE